MTAILNFKKWYCAIPMTSQVSVEDAVAMAACDTPDAQFSRILFSNKF